MYKHYTRTKNWLSFLFLFRLKNEFGKTYTWCWRKEAHQLPTFGLSPQKTQTKNATCQSLLAFLLSIYVVPIYPNDDLHTFMDIDGRQPCHVHHRWLQRGNVRHRYRKEGCNHSRYDFVLGNFQEKKKLPRQILFQSSYYHCYTACYCGFLPLSVGLVRRSKWRR